MTRRAYVRNFQQELIYFSAKKCNTTYIDLDALHRSCLCMYTLSSQAHAKSHVQLIEIAMNEK
jgi:hypothetical protein